MSQVSIFFSLLALVLASCGQEQSGKTSGTENNNWPSASDLGNGNEGDSASPDDAGGQRSKGASTAGSSGSDTSSANPLPSAPSPSSPSPSQPSPTNPSSGQTPSLQEAAQEFALPRRTFDTKAQFLWATYYHTLRFTHADNGLALLAMDGSPLGPKLTKAQWCTAAMEGSVQIFFEGVLRTYNYSGSGTTVQVDCSDYFDHPVGRSRFKLARGEFGDGVRNYALSPYRTVAVDPDFIPYGAILFIPAARGLSFQLPDGRTRTHDGYFFAGDTGGLIVGNHIDVFIGTSLTNPFSWITSKAQSKIEFQLVPDQDISAALLRLHQ